MPFIVETQHHAEVGLGGVGFAHQVQLAFLVFVARDHRVATIVGAVHVDDSLRLVLGAVATPQAINALVSNITTGAEERRGVFRTATRQTEYQQGGSQFGGDKQKGPLSRPLAYSFHCKQLLNSFFQSFTRNERRHVGSCDFDFFTSLWVTTSTLVTMIYLESPETNQLYSITFFQRLGNSKQCRFKSNFGLCFGKISFVRNYINQLSLVHKLSFTVCLSFAKHRVRRICRLTAPSCIHAPIATFFTHPKCRPDRVRM